MHDRAGAPIGIFDSGIGGWSVLREIRRELPYESLHYVADTGYAPYGERSASEISARAHAVAGYLVDVGAKALVVACNTATAAAVAWLRECFDVPIVAMEPAVKPAARMSRSGVIGVLATRVTVDSEQLARLSDAHGQKVRILACAAAGLVECIEAGDFDGPHTRQLIERYVVPLREQGADVIVLGCTHFPLVRAHIERVAGPACTVLDPAPAVARELRRRLTESGLLDGGPARAPRYSTTGSADRLRLLLRSLACVEPDIDVVRISDAINGPPRPGPL